MKGTRGNLTFCFLEVGCREAPLGGTKAEEGQAWRGISNHGLTEMEAASATGFVASCNWDCKMASLAFGLSELFCAYCTDRGDCVYVLG